MLAASPVSSLQGLSLEEFITTAIEHEPEMLQLKLSPTRVSLPIVRSKNPGAVKVTAEQIAALLEAEIRSYRPPRSDAS